MSAEAAAINLGRVLATRAVSLWLGPRRREQEAASSMSELIRVRVSGLRYQRSLERQFEDMADAVAARLEPLLAHEFRGLAANERRAATDAVCDTFARADLSDEAVIGADADPAELARRIRRAVAVPPGLSEPALAFHEALFAESVDCYVRILRHLPVFTERAVTELLGRTTTLAAEVARALDRLPARSLYAPEGTGEDEAFRREYLALISETLDEVELFSFASERAPRTKLSVAYVSLRTSVGEGARRSRRIPSPRRSASAWAEEDEGGHGVRVEAALGEARRVLLRGEAGSGKTTLLQWLAVTAARGAFTGELAGWNGLVPVMVKLRRYAGRELPSPEALLDQTAGPLTGHMPKAWTDRLLSEGRVLLMVDGVDELPAGERRGVRQWLRNLLAAYPDNRVVVTSRPAAAGKDWLRTEEFQPVLLDRMRPADLVAFVRQWHQAVREQGDRLPCEPAQLPDYERSLITSLQDRPHLQSLAASPLLAALLCALHLERRRQLPRNRMELYRTALEILLHRRDTERGVPGDLDVSLTLTDKLRLLQDLAWRLSDNNRSEIARERAAGHVHAALGRMRHLDGVDGEAVLEHLLVRSGVLRAPAEDRVDFLHRSFQEYLAAAEAASEDRIGNLVERAHLDLWHETIVMTAGHANRTQREELVHGILARAAAEPRHTRRLRLLAASCLETMPSVPDAVSGPLDEALDALIPPRRMSEAASLAAVGAPVLRRLPDSLAGLSDAAVEALVRTASLIGGEQAMDRLGKWADTSHPAIRRHLVDCWESFESTEYARRVLKRLPLEDRVMFVTHPAQACALRELPEIRHVVFECPIEGFSDLGLPGDLASLHMFELRGTMDLSPLRAYRRLQHLSLCGQVPLRDTAVLGDLAELETLTLLWDSLPAPARTSLPPNIASLTLATLEQGADLAPLTSLAMLRELRIDGHGSPEGLLDLAGLESLQLLELGLYDLSTWPANVRSAAPELTTLTLQHCLLPDDLGILSALGPVRSLRLKECTTPDGRPPNLESVPEGIEVQTG
ncbi:NACHT domain-containing protein [Streptomyces sp. NBC_00249]|uniref:NACHT domain-containing protein n=1 Tax=Streptomyces sp. NBC_00249 TaxID=2975690 RepID=UPI00224E9895|nr:NACHT domain-containing protein [Streptomyces sp. NBC_00249]MCX5194153.1 NACHT domain-containing protein [Streptomyces sp. NBC_00249]